MILEPASKLGIEARCFSKSSYTAAKLIRLIYVCLSGGKLAERKDILEKEYNISMTDTEASDMCNLGIGIYNKGFEQGETVGIELKYTP